MLLPSLLLLSAGTLTEGFLNGNGDRTSLIFAETAPPPVPTSPNPTGASGTNATTTPSPIVLPLITPPNGTVNGIGGPMTLPWLNGTGNGAFVLPTVPSLLNFTVPNLNWTNSNGTFVLPTLPSLLNFTTPNLNWTNSNGTVVLPTIPPLNWPFPGLNFTSNSTLFPIFNPQNWTFPWLNFTTNSTLFPPINWGNISFTTPRPGTNSTGGTIAFSTTTAVPSTNLSTPRPTGWPWVPSSSTSLANLSTTTSRPGSTEWWTVPWWASWNRSTTASPGTSRAWFGTTAATSGGTTIAPFSPRSPTETTTRSPVSFGSTTQFPGTSTRSPFSSGTTAWFTGGTSTSSPFSSGTTQFPGTTTRSPLYTDVPNSLSRMLQNWRSRFAADLEAVKMNITQLFLH